MHNINLLPWRQKLIAQHRRQFWFKCSFVFVTLISAIVFIHTFLMNIFYSQEIRNQRLTQEIVKQSRILKVFTLKEEERKILQSKLDILYQLRLRQNKIIILFNLLPEVIPKNVVLEKISMKKELVQIEGRGINNLSLSAMLSLLEQHAHIQNVKIHSIVNLDENGLSQFNATFALIGYTKLI